MPRFVTGVLAAAFLAAAPLIAASKNAKASDALLAAASKNESDDILAALKAGADANARDDKGNTALILISSDSLFGHEQDVLNALLKAKADVDAKNKEGQTALMIATANDRWNFVKMLIDAGAKVNARDNDGWTPLMYAAVNDSNTSADALLKANADVNNADTKGYTAVMVALDRGRGNIAEKLLKAGGTCPAKSPSGISSLVASVFGRDLQGVRLALDPSRKQDVNSRDEDGWPAVSIAAYNDDRQIMMELLRAGADPTLKDKDGKTALDRANENENKEVAAILTGKWDKPKFDKGTNVTVPCKDLGGSVATNVMVDGDVLVFTTYYPHPLSWYLGGGAMNRAKSAVKYTYNASIEPSYQFASGYGLSYSQYGTSVQLKYKDSEGRERQKSVYENVLSAEVKKGEEDVDVSSVSDDDRPRAINDEGLLRTRVPMSVLGLKAGPPVKVTAKIGSCGPVTAQVALK